uniref:Uncharacterized protein n=1 Tax=Arundo donax TaxID=35708 RepID=A0A0A9BPW2_ARUDO
MLPTAIDLLCFTFSHMQNCQCHLSSTCLEFTPLCRH